MHFYEKKAKSCHFCDKNFKSDIKSDMPPFTKLYPNLSVKPVSFL